MVGITSHSSCIASHQWGNCVDGKFLSWCAGWEEKSGFVLGTSQGCLGTSWHVLARLGSDMRYLGRGVWTVAGGTVCAVGAVCAVDAVCVARPRDAKNGASCAYGSAWVAWAAWAMPSCRRTALLPVPYAAPSGHFCAPPPLAK